MATESGAVHLQRRVQHAKERKAEASRRQEMWARFLPILEDEADKAHTRCVLGTSAIAKILQSSDTGVLKVLDKVVQMFTERNIKATLQYSGQPDGIEGNKLNHVTGILVDWA